VIAPATAETLEGGSRALVRRWRKPVDQWLSETAAPIGHSMTTALDHSSKVELTAAGVHPVGMISSHASV